MASSIPWTETALVESTEEPDQFDPEELDWGKEKKVEKKRTLESYQFEKEVALLLPRRITNQMRN